MTTLRVMMSDDSGATMVEYGVMVALVAAVCFAIIVAFGHSVSSMYSSANQPL